MTTAQSRSRRTWPTGRPIGSSLVAAADAVSDATEAKVAARVLATCGAALEEPLPAEKLAPAAVDQSGDGVEAERARLAARVLLGERAALEACQSVWEKVAEKAEEAKEAAA